MDPYAGDELAALYDLFYANYADDLAMYESFARRGETPVLELGAGTGRVALHLARAGIDVVALDGSPSMLNRFRVAMAAEAMAKRIRIVEADIRSFEIGERFDLIFCAANTFQHILETADQLAALRCVAAHLTTGGVFVAKLQPVSAVDWGADVGELKLAETRIDPMTGERVMRLNAQRARAAALRTDVTRIYDRIGGDGTVRRRITQYTLKYTTPDELNLLLERSGLRLHHLYGNHDLSPFGASSDSMIFVAGLEG
jgi:SAM-dependent methyltransferase